MSFRRRAKGDHESAEEGFLDVAATTAPTGDPRDPAQAVVGPDLEAPLSAPEPSSAGPDSSSNLGVWQPDDGGPSVDENDSPISPVSDDEPESVLEDPSDDVALEVEPPRPYEPPTIGSRQPAAEAPPKLAMGRPGLADTAIDGGSVGEVQVRAASVRGAAARYYGESRQDAYALGSVGDPPWLIIAVADGVSSARNADLGAKEAAEGAVSTIAAALAISTPTELDWDAVIGQVAQRVAQLGLTTIEPESDESEAARNERAAEDIATTLTVAVVPTSANGGLAHICSVGDSPAWLLTNGVWRQLSDSKNEGVDVASSATLALPFVPDRVLASTVRLCAGDVLVLMSDGIGDPLGNARNDVAEYLAEAWTTPPPMLKFAADVQFRRRGWDDDRTGIAVWIPPEDQ